jgi:MraZ protein
MEVTVMFMGEMQNTIDDKNRMIVPVKFRAGLGDQFVITRGLDDCLFVYPHDQWERIVSKVRAMDPMQANVRYFQRYFISGAADSELDKQGRVLVPVHLREHAKLEKECVVVGVGDRIEVWSKSVWDSYFHTNLPAVNEIAEQLAGLL